MPSSSASGNASAETLKPSPTRIGLFYASSTCYTEMVAEKIQQLLGKDRVDLHNISNTAIDTIHNYHYLLFGIPTWDYGELQEDWDQVWDELDQLELSGYHAAIFGLGDQRGYPQWFQDALGYLYHKLVGQGANLSGLWPNQGYEYEQSQALIDDDQYFCGLALDEENQAELTETRLQQWLDQVLNEFQLPPAEFKSEQ